MRSVSRLFFAPVVAALLVAVTATSALPAPRDVARDIERHIEQGLAANGVPGAALALIDADGGVQLRGFGTTGRGDERVTPDTPFLIGSITKSFTALAVMQLVEDGSVDLDTPVSRYLPWFAVEPAAETRAVTVRTLLDHTSGLPADAGGPALQWFQDLPIREAAMQVAGVSLVTPPGTAWAYSNANYALLGALIETVSGRDYAEVIRARILEPLGMDRTFTDLEEARAAGMAEGHRYWFGRPVAHVTYREGMLPEGLLISTAADMSRYLEMMLGGGALDGRRVLSEAGIRQMTEPTVGAVLGPWAKERAAAYAMGWFVGGAPFGPETAVFHPGATPDFGALAAILPARDQAVVVMVNAAPRVNMPGAAGAVDRIAAGAVSILMGSEPATGPTMRSYYRVFNVLVGAALLAIVIGITVTLRRRPSRHRGWRRLLQVAGAVAPVGAAALLLGAPGLTGTGWGQAWLWTPDHMASVLALGAALLGLAAVRAHTLLRSHVPPAAPSEPRPGGRPPRMQASELVSPAPSPGGEPP